MASRIRSIGWPTWGLVLAVIVLIVLIAFLVTPAA
jgi:hypothetical protein